MKIFTHLTPHRGSEKYRLYSTQIPTRKKQGHWLSQQNQKDFFEQLKDVFGIKDLDDWYNIRWQDVVDNGGKGVLARYDNSLASALKSVYPSHNWRVWCFKSVPAGFWNTMKNQQSLFNDMAQSLNYKILDDWHNITLTAIAERNGGGLLYNRYCNSPVAALQAIYPEHPWRLNMFRQSPQQQYSRGHWGDQDNVLNFIRTAEQELGISRIDEWYRVSQDQIKRVGGGGLLHYYPGILQQYYPEEDWHFTEFSRQEKKSTQRLLCVGVKYALPKYDVLEEYCITDDDVMGMYIVVDVYVPELKLALEYQGEHHYHDVNISRFQPASVQRDRDIRKRQICKEMGITVIAIPYWWKGDRDTISATIAHYRPDIMLDVPEGIPPLLESSFR